jgi:hypothetical protein
MNTPHIFDPADPVWLAHRYEPVRDQLLYRAVQRAIHRDGAFLTDELVGDRPQHVLGRLDGVAAARTNPAPVHFIFHSAFCASTLLVRAFDLPGVSMGLSEPVLLNDVTGLHRRGEHKGAELAKLLDDCVTLLARRWDAEAGVVIKPSNILCGLQRPILALRPQARAVMLHAPLPTFLASVARKGLWCRLWARELLEGLLRDGLVDFGFGPADYFRLSDLQVAAVGWLAQHQQFALLAQHFPDRVRSLRSDQLLGDPDRVLGAVATLFGLPAVRFAGHPALARHSKSGEAFSPAEREAEQAAAQAAHGDEIDKVDAWARVLAERAGIAITLPVPLVA